MPEYDTFWVTDEPYEEEDNQDFDQSRDYGDETVYPVDEKE